MVLDGKQITRLAIPVLLEQCLLQLGNVVNLVFVSTAGSSAMAGVSVVDQITVMAYCTFTIAGIGVSIAISQLSGQGDQEGVRRATFQALVLGGLFAALWFSIGFFFNRPLLSLLLNGAEAAVLRDAQLYFRLSALSYPFYMLYTVLIFALRGKGETRATMFVTLTQSGLNALLAYLFVTVLQLGVVGAGLALIGARAGGGLFALLFSWRTGLIQRGLPKRLERGLQKQILGLGLPGGCESMVLAICKVSILTMLVSAGTAQIAAVAPCQVGIDLAALLPLAVCTVAPTCVGFAKASLDEGALRRYGDKLALVGLALGVLSHALAFFLIGPYVSLFQLPQETLDTMVRILRLGMGAQALTWSIAYVLPPIMRGAGDVLFGPVFSLLTCVFLRVPLTYWFCRLGMGAYGVYVAMFVDFGFKGLANVFYYLSGRWTRKQKIQVSPQEAT